MGTPFVGEIRITPYNFAPYGWLYCDGSLLNIAEFEVLFALLGTTYGGDGQTTFGLPDLRSRVPLHQGSSSGNTYSLAQQGGVENVTLTAAQLPTHNHPFVATASSANQPGPSGSYPSNAGSPVYTADVNNVTAMGSNPISGAGGNQPHNNVMPYLGIAFIICYAGIYPSQD